MNSNERHKYILEQLNIKDFIKVSEIAEKLDVSSVTIRKDLQDLENVGLLYRNHGGASKQKSYVFEQNLSEKELLNVDEKQDIAREAKSYIENGDSIIIGSGTSTLYLSKILSGYTKLQVVTPSLTVASELAKDRDIDVIQLGGEIRKSSNSVIGSSAEAQLKNYACNKLFLGVDGIDYNFGLSTSNAMEASLNRVMIDQADKVIVLADSDKMNKRGFGKICDMEKVDILITDAHITEREKEELLEKGVEVRVV